MKQSNNAAAEKTPRAATDRHLQVANFILAVATFVLVALQWRSADQQLGELKIANGIASDNLKKTQRAWVGLRVPTETQPFFERPIVGQPLMRMHYAAHNYGASTALHALQRSYTEVHSGPVNWPAVEAEIAKNPYDNLPFNIFSGQEILVDINTGIGWTKEYVDQINAGKSTWFAAGKFYYVDEFGTEHLTTWCVFYQPPTGSVAASFGVCPINQVAT